MFRKLPRPPCLAPLMCLVAHSLQVKLKERDQPDSTTVSNEQPLWRPSPPRLATSSPWPPCRGQATTSRHAPTPLTLLLFFLFSVLLFPFFAFLFARETQSRHDSVSPSLLNSICTKSFALVWSRGTGLESPSECASELLSVPGLCGARLPSTSGGARVRPSV